MIVIAAFTTTPATGLRLAKRGAFPVEEQLDGITDGSGVFLEVHGDSNLLKS